MKKVNISVDCDGVLMKTSCAICELVNLMTCRNYTFKDINSWDFWQKEGRDKQFWEAYNYFDRQGRLNIKPYDDYIFTALRDINYIVGGRFDIVTANNEDSADHIKDWVLWNWYAMGHEMNYPSFDIKCIGRVTCAEKLSLPYDIYLDDNPNMAAEIVNFPEKSMIIFNCPWNKNVKNTNQVTRVESWKEVPGLIKNIIKNLKSELEYNTTPGHPDNPFLCNPPETLRAKAARLGFKEIPEKYNAKEHQAFYP